MTHPTTADTFTAFNRQIDLCRAWLGSRSFRRFGYTSEVLADRLTQYMVETGLGPYAKAVHGRITADAESPFPSTGWIHTETASFEIGSGRIGLTARQVFRRLAEFGVHWLYAALAICVRGKRRGRAPGVLVHDMPTEDLFDGDSDRRFVDYCDRGPLGPLRSGTRFFVETPGTAVSTDSRITYCRMALVAALQHAKLGATARLHLLARHGALLWRFPAAVLRDRPLALLARESAYTELANALDHLRLIESVVITCGNWGTQPLWMRNLQHAKVHMVWYSQSARSARYRTDSESADGPRVRWIDVDIHWVWTTSLAQYLRERVPAGTAIHAVGPLIWQLPEATPPSPDARSVSITVFDVPAVNDDVMVAQVGEISNYYNSRHLRAFLEGILEMKPALERELGVPVSISLKMKRGLRPHYSREHFAFLDGLLASGAIGQVSFSANLFSVVSSSHLVIAYPFTSPAYLAEWLKVPAVFFDATATLVRDDFPESPDAVAFARGTAELWTALVGALRSALPAGARIESA